MQNVVAVVDLASPLKCITCHQETPEWVCSSCHHPLLIHSDWDYFQILGWSHPFFGINLHELRRRFYERSRLLHPDRFSQDPIETQEMAIKEMSLLNQAYVTLQNPSLLRNYILKKHDISLSQSLRGLSNRVQGIADLWFDLSESEEGASPQAQIKLQIQAIEEELEEAMKALEGQYDQENIVEKKRELLTKMVPLLQDQNYLRSLRKQLP